MSIPIPKNPRLPKDKRAARKQAWKYLSIAVRTEAADDRGYCTCVCCGYQAKWDSGDIHPGHYVAAGTGDQIRFEPESNINIQCRGCNTSGHINWGYGGRRKSETVSQAYHAWMLKTYGAEEIERIRLARRSGRTYTFEQLVEMRDRYIARARAGLKIIEGKF